MELDNKKKGLLFILGASLVGVVLLFVWLYGRRGKEEEPKREVKITAEVQTAAIKELPETKMNAYKRSSGSSIEQYWDDMGNPDVEQEDPLADLSNRRSSQSKGSAPTGGDERSYEEIIGQLHSPQPGRETSEERMNRRRQEDAKIVADMQAQQMREISKMIEQQNEANAKAEKEKEKNAADAPEEVPAAPVREERDKIDIDRVKVVRSGGISTMEDDFGGVSASGVSSLDGEDREFDADEAYPFKCMFVRQERLKSSQRVSVRLLEDIVVEGQLVKKNTHLNAVCSIGDRVDLKVTSLDINGRIVNLDFDAYDNDGMKGIYAPDLEGDETQVADAMRRVGIAAGQRSLRTAVGQTVQDIIRAGSMVITGTGADRTVTIPAGYQFYLVKSKGRGKR